MIRALLVDDETPARNELKRFLKTESDFEVVSEAADGEAALQLIKQLKPDVVFLDIHIPKPNGLEVASLLAAFEQPPLVIFVTAFDQYAIQAFEMSAIDYLLKPFEEERFKKSCARVRKSLTDPRNTRKSLKELDQFLKKKPLKVLGHRRRSRDRIFIHERDVLYFHVRLTEVTAHMTNGEEYLISSNLRQLLDMLDPDRFQQTHRAFVVNLDQVEKVAPLFAGNFNLTLKDSAKSRIPLSRRYARKLREFLKW